MQNIKLLIATLVGTLLFIFAVGFFFSQGSVGAPQESVSNLELVPEGSHVRGATESAQFTIVEFSDFQCPACAVLAPSIKALLAQYPEVQFVYRHFPLLSIHANAESSAWASEAAGEQGKFWEMHDQLFATQAQWSELADPQEFFVNLAAQLELDTEKFVADYSSDSVKNTVATDLRQAEQLRLNSTPTLFLNGEKMPINQIESVLQQNLSAQ